MNQKLLSSEVSYSKQFYYRFADILKINQCIYKFSQNANWILKSHWNFLEHNAFEVGIWAGMRAPKWTKMSTFTALFSATVDHRLSEPVLFKSYWKALFNYCNVKPWFQNSWDTV